MLKNIWVQHWTLLCENVQESKVFLLPAALLLTHYCPCYLSIPPENIKKTREHGQ